MTNLALERLIKVTEKMLALAEIKEWGELVQMMDERNILYEQFTLEVSNVDGKDLLKKIKYLIELEKKLMAISEVKLCDVKQELIQFKSHQRAEKSYQGRS